MKKAIPVIFMAFALLSCSRDAGRNLTVQELRCNNLSDPGGSGPDPVFSWILSSPLRGVSQNAYQILMAENAGDLKSEERCIWNSGRVVSGESVRVAYAGPELKPATKYFWKVRAWDNRDNPSGWSRPAFFITGLFDGDDWEGAEWIGFEEVPDSMLLVPGIHRGLPVEGHLAEARTVVPLFRREVSLDKKIAEAFVFVSGLGHYELHINGRRIGDSFLSPGWTDYDKTCFYNTYEITDELKKGKNVIGAIAGNGFFNINRERYYKLVINYGAPRLKLLLKIRYSDGSGETLKSDGLWKTAPSPVTFSSIFGGEDYDARLEQPGWNNADFDEASWKNVLIVREPKGALKPEPDHPLKVMQTFSPRRIFSPASGIYIYDFGQNASGIINLRIKGRSGQNVLLKPAELLGSDSLIMQKASGEPYWFSYTTGSGREEEWRPKFSYYGFRYVQVEGAVPEGMPNPDNLPVITGLQMLHTRNSSPAAGSFECSNDLFNRIFSLIDWAIRSNLASVATDCPHREKLGWLEQTHLMGNSVKYVYDIHNLFSKMIDDMIEAQLDNGLVPDIAPEYVEFVGGFRDSPEWSSACIILPWNLYEWYGDIDAVKRAYPMMKRYLDYLGSRSRNGILNHGLGDWYDLGPEFPGVAQLTPIAVTATSIYYYDARLLAGMARILDEESDAAFYGELAERIRTAFNREFFNPLTKVYSTGSQTAYAMPLFFGMTDDSLRSEVVNNLVKSINDGNRALTAGDVGYRYLLRVLEQEGHSGLIFDMNSKTDVPGYGYQMSKGATALTESWAGLAEVSNNHMMLGHLMEWFFSGLGGIRQDENSKAFKHIVVSPEIAGDITRTDCSWKSVYGEISSSWKLSGNELTLKVRIPVSCTATIRFPQSDAAKIKLDGKAAGNSGDVHKIRNEGGKICLDILSGNYTFSCEMDAGRNF